MLIKSAASAATPMPKMKGNTLTTAQLGLRLARLMAKMEGMKQQVENMGTINKLADVVGTFGGDGAAPPPPVKFTPPGLEELKAKADEIRGKQDL